MLPIYFAELHGNDTIRENVLSLAVFAALRLHFLQQLKRIIFCLKRLKKTSMCLD